MNFPQWFSITGNLRRLYSDNNSNPRNTDEINLKSVNPRANYFTIISMYILREIYLKLSEIIHESLIYKGVLSVFTPNLTLNLDSRQNIRENIFSILSTDYSKDFYYYITGNTYNKEYLDSIKNNPDDNNWFYTYALDWLSQINFYHHTINNRISFVTGSTGVGKSTQAPKLILYAYRMLFYNNTVKILCSQPRIPPTIGNAARISQELGVLIDQEKKANYFVQFQYSDDKHIPLEYFTSFYLRIMTDGALLENIKTNITLYQNYKIGKEKIIINKNLYDVIIVDEAHEHNKNMDLILTIVKRTMKLNKSIKLFIVSATMDDDEPRYRYYYKEILDRYQFPNFILQSKLLNIVDRRIHISPYGKTTRFIIKEFYETIEPVDYKASETIGIQRVLDIARKTPSGEILFFSVGEKEIKYITTELNNFLPSSTIALPYYSKLPGSYKEIFNKLKKNLNLIKYNRKYIIDLLEKYPTNWTESDLPYEKVGGPYTRAVIIATNVAEASVTISSLKYVVDTGFNKVSIFNPLTGGIQIQLAKISESSRLQRKGRVGRVSNGTVYYVYKKESRKDILTQYKITIEMVYDTILSLLNTTPITEKYYESYQSLYLLNPRNKLSREFIFPEAQIAKEEDFTLSIDTLLDNKFEFYIIHPNENLILRDQYSEKITKVSEKKQDYSLQYIHNILKNDAILRSLFFNEENLAILKTIMLETGITQFSVFNFVSLILAYRFKFEIFYKLAWLLFNLKVELETIDLNANIKVEQVSFSKDPEVNILALPLNERCNRLYWIFQTFCTIQPLPIRVPLSDKEKLFYCLYYSNPLNIALYMNGYKNKYSTAPLSVRNTPVSNYYLGYFSTIGDSLMNIFPLNYEQFSSVH
jgi:hypothetical protein